MTRIVGLSGVAGAGKDTAADILVRDHGFVKVALADPLKRMVREAFDFSEDQLWGPSAMRDAPDSRYGGLTPRKALQLLGTEWGRACYADVWVEAMIRTARALLGERRPVYAASTGLSYRHTFEDLNGRSVRGVVIPDVRFLNEFRAIRGAGGVVYRIIRSGTGLHGAAATHVSENELIDDMFPTCWRVDNNGTLDDLAVDIRMLGGVSRE